MADQTKTPNPDFDVRVAEILAYQQAAPKPKDVSGHENAISGWTRAVPIEVANECVVAGVLRRGMKNGRHLVIVETETGATVAYSLSDLARERALVLEAQFQNEIAD